MSSKENSDQAFDLNKLNDIPELKRYFAMVQLRMDEVIRSITVAYDMPAYSEHIHAIIADSMEFNAKAALKNKTTHVTVNASVLMILRTLFDHILSNDNVFPQLTNSQNKQKINYQTEFTLDPNQPFKRPQVAINLSEERYKASGILSDLCISFIFLHEFGHVLYGHTAAIQHDNSSTPLLEFVKVTKRKEMDANQTQEMATHVAAITLASLHTLFLYMDNCQFQVSKTSYHPPAQTRVMYIKETFCGEMSRRWSINPDDIISLYIHTYFGSLSASLHEFGLQVEQGFKQNHLQLAHKMEEDLWHAHEKYADFSKKWSWL